jgi:basic membrane protein A
MLAAMVLAACSPAATEAPPEAPAAATEAPAEPTEAPPEETEPPEAMLKICQVTDVGGIDDKTFNATAWKGVTDAEEAFGVEGKFLESQQQTDYAVNINAFVEEGCELIVTVGFLLGADTAIAAEANPDQKFAIIDFAYFDEEGNKVTYDNVVELTFATDQAAFLAGYAAAGTTQTGIVGTFGGIPIPPVTVFMDGFWAGVQYYNEQNGTDVQVLGWDPATQEGLFTGNFESTDDGRALGESLMDEGADIILPVAGPVGLGTAAAVQERGNAYIVGVDTDMSVSAPEFADVILTSILKNMDVAVFLTTESVIDGSYAGGMFVGTLDNDGVGLAPFNDMEGLVPDAVKSDIETITAAIISGEISASPGVEPVPPLVAPEGFKVCQVTDVGGIDDKTFNATAWKGVTDAEEAFGFEGKFLESQQQTDYAVNINAFIEEGCELIVTVGFLLGADTAIAAEANPDQKFAIIDFAYFDEEGNKVTYDNVVELTFGTDQAAFLAGYVAAGTTQTGTVGTFGGIPIPPVTVFMDGFWYGVDYYNQQNGTDVQVLGWDPATQEGLFTGNFESTDDGRALGESLMDEGADIILPVAGPVGLGTAAAVQERGNAYIIGVDTDMSVSAPEFADVILTSVLKNMDVAVFLTTESVLDGSYAGGMFIGTLENDGVGLASFNDLEDMVPDAVKDALPDLIAGIIAGDIQTSP